MSEKETKTPYRVLARKYRPSNFDELIGQEALVRTLRNAIDSGRVAHAFMLTGVRGVGKTTTARIIAKALNYTGADGNSGPTSGNTDDCEICKAISEDRHPDVIEMDAASRTGIDDIREILDGVRYAPTSARYKIYIIDEIHMLSKQAFNALLKTLEEPPEHVKFIFATTEIRKVPITVLSRCQKFDLRRVNVETLSKHFKNICAKEDVTFDDDAIKIISRASDGSVRDGLSILDQAMALGTNKVETAQVEEMLGLFDRSKILSLFDNAIKGKPKEALKAMEDLYSLGADPVILIQDLLNISHILTKLKVSPETKDTHANMAEDQIQVALDLANNLSMPSIGRAWQILLKGLQEVASAPNPQVAAEMVVIRLCYASNLPDPSSLIKKIKAAQANGGTISGAGTSVTTSQPSSPVSIVSNIANNGNVAMIPQTSVAMDKQEITCLEEVVQLLRYNNDSILAANVEQFCHPVKVKRGVVEFRQAEGSPDNIVQNLRESLNKYTGDRWNIAISRQGGEDTISQKINAAKNKKIDEIKSSAIVSAVIKEFKNAKIISIINEDNGDKLIWT